MGAPGPEQRKEPRYQVTYHTYLASGRRLSYTRSVERVVGLKYAKRSLLVLQNFAIFRLRHAHVRKDTRLSTAFPYWKRRKAGRGLGTRLPQIIVCQYRGKDHRCVSGVRRYPLWAFGILPVGVVMCVGPVEHGKVAFADLSVAVPW